MSQCQECPAECEDHKWGRIKAQNLGWFFTRSGLVYCPQHNPSWVKSWRHERDGIDYNEPPCNG